MDKDGDERKKSKECKENLFKCKNLKEINLTLMDSETYECLVCGEYFKLYYEDMQ